MKLKIKSPSLDKTLQYLKIQAQESVPQIPFYFNENITTGEQFFNICKSKITYTKDTDLAGFGVEYFQTVKTLFEKNNGKGDCDDFTILGLAGLTYLELADSLFIVLVGATKKKPTHIYIEYMDRGTPYTFDLTNPYFNFERKGKYKFKQLVRIKL